MELKREVDLKTSLLKITVNVDSKLWVEEQEKVKNNLIKNVVVPGFRKGKVPHATAEKKINQHSVIEKSLNNLLPKVAQEAAREIKPDDIILGEASFAVDSLTKTELIITVSYPIYPEFELKGYKDSGIKLEEKTVTEAELDEQKRKLVEKNSVMISTENPIKKGDLILFSFKGFIEGKEFEGGSADEFELKIGSGHFIPGFEENLIGKTKGFKGSIDVVFPEDYHMEKYAGKPATFEIEIFDVKEIEVPELTDEFITELAIPNVKTIAEFSTYLRDLTEREVKEAARVKFQEKLFSNIIKQTTFPIPETIILSEMKSINQKFEDSLKSQGFTRKEYLELTNFNEEQIGQQIRDEALKNLKKSLIFAEVAKLEKLEVSDAEYDEEYEKLMKVYGISTIEEIKKVLPRTNLQMPILNRKVIDRLIELNK
ncbi:trigger factor [Mycoplasma iguanae]|uniref:Trigger factor n=1 Tax=Mycoplasma iguanae TaxID=292461 RepID=A0ABY5R8Z6_9MOLU|nr:trigger factor [Mycoplasma iguanae]UVD81913.1 trigger factor [Mycoplasma iguanae]